ncbi:sialate O-acetylesterase [Fibrella aquatica]|uniref:sialate O-acetylesterase n=1 Tax=Fibrella aquatica TaxID=3242487 RepID=UPI00351F8526
MTAQLRIAVVQLVRIVLFCFVGTSGWAQQINVIAFDKLPQNYQLYPRNEQSEAQIPIAGRVNEAGWQYVSVQVFRNKQAIGYRRAIIQYAGAQGRFTVDPITIRAEKAQYDVSVHLVKGADSIHVVSRTSIVSGDVYVLTGQSNASAFFREKRTNEFCRTFGKTSGTYGVEASNPADTAWALSNQTLLEQNVGTFGFEFQEFILSTYGIPTCLINAAFHWSMMAHHATRTPGNPADLTNGYGRMLYRLQKGGLDKHVKALIYRQGESEAYGEGVNWPGNFDTYYKNLKTDLPSVKQLYVYQIDIIDPAVAAAPLVREAQRSLANRYQDIQVLPSIGTAGFDGLHYSDEGYAQNAQEVARLVGRDFYGATDTDNIDTPIIKQAYFSKKDGTEITLRFNDGQVLTWTDQFENVLLKNVFYIDGREGEVTGGRAAGNRIILTLKNPSSATKLTYLPPKVDPGGPNFPYRGPYITNKRGMRALSFYELSITETIVGPDEPTPLPAPILSVGVVSASSLQLSWNAVAEATAYVLEVKEAKSGTFTALKQLPAGTLTYLAEGLLTNNAYTFRIRALGKNTESAWYQVDGQTPAVPSAPVLQGAATFANVVSLAWQPVAEALGYVIDRRLATETAFTSVTSVGATTLNFIDRLVSDNRSYVYRIKATGRYADSPYTTANVQTPAFLALPKIDVDVLYNNALSVKWEAVANAVSYELARKTADGDFQKLGTFGPDVMMLRDTNLLIGTTYTYQIKAVGDRTESPFATVTATTPSLLDTPTISLTVVYNNALEIKWTPVSNATAYQLERVSPNQEPTEVGTFTAQVVAFSDTNLTPGTTYTYRIIAIGDKTESPIVSVSAVTPNRLATPNLLLTPASFDVMTLSWAPVPEATHYLLERKLATATSYENTVRLEALQSAYRDTLLTPSTAYQYRLTAYGNKTQSEAALAEATTLVLLSVDSEPTTTVSLWPNPAPGGQFSVHLSSPTSGLLQVLDVQGSVKLEQQLVNATQVPVSLTGYPTGMYLIRIRRGADTLVQKLVVN